MLSTTFFSDQEYPCTEDYQTPCYFCCFSANQVTQGKNKTMIYFDKIENSILFSFVNVHPTLQGGNTYFFSDSCF